MLDKILRIEEKLQYASPRDSDIQQAASRDILSMIPEPIHIKVVTLYEITPRFPNLHRSRGYQTPHPNSKGKGGSHTPSKAHSRHRSPTHHSRRIEKYYTDVPTT